MLTRPHPTLLLNLLPHLALILLLTGCGASSDRRSIPDSELHPARSEAHYAPILPGCVKLYNRDGNNNHSFCRLEQLPLLGQEHTQLTPDDVLERTLVSHGWMAQRFEQALHAMPDDLLQLFQGVTAVAIGADIRPSYYWLSTGAIYLDPSRLWLELEERDTISQAPDFRSDFGKELQFETLWRYVKHGDYAWRNPPLSGPGQARTLEQIVPPMAALLFHELAHANDYIPPSHRARVDSSLTVSQVAVQLQADSISATLANTYPLNSTQMMDLAEVLFSGRDATPAEKHLSAETVGWEFSDDTATDPYGYVSNSRRRLFLEDTAMLFEEAMMRHHFGITRELAVTDRPESEDAGCNDYIIRWGERGRIGDPRIQPRLELVLASLLDHGAIEPYLKSLEHPEPLPNHSSWCINTQGAQAATGTSLQGRSTEPLPQEERRHPPGHPHHNFR